MKIDLSYVEGMSTKEIAEALHDLSVHQAELEMQNDQLRLTKEELNISQGRLFKIFYEAPVGYLIMDAEGRIKQSNEKFSELVGVDGSNILERNIIEFIHSKDRLAFKAWKKKSIAEVSDGTFEISRRDNRVVFLRFSLTQLSLTDEEPLLLLTCTDVSELKKTEEGLRVSSIVFDTASEAAMVVDSDFLIISINPAFTKITGYESTEIIGKNPKVISSGLHEKGFYRDFYNALIKEGRWEGEIWNRRKNGAVYPQWLSVNVIRDIFDNPHRYVCVFRDETINKEAQALIRKQATHDALTGLPNRTLFNDRLEQAILHSKRSRKPFALLFIDLDGFKDINDTLGHHAGDQLLKDVSARLMETVRDSDTVARLGGDEFSILLLDVDNRSNIEALLSKMLNTISLPFWLGDERCYVTASIGVTYYPNDSLSASELYINADQAMYAAKRAGKNSYQFFSKEMNDIASERNRISNELRSSSLDEFELHYQPVIDLASGKVIKAEGLLRWVESEGQSIGPNVFIPIAEENGFIFQLGDFVFNRAISDVYRLRNSCCKDFQVSINKSPKQFMSEHHSTDSWAKRLNDEGLPGDCLIVEITEGLLLENTSVVSTELLEMRDAGIQVALDDFGTGYSSLAYLTRFDIDYLKIDQSFIALLPLDRDSRVLCEAIVAMAHKLDLKVIAEGIETIEQYDFLIGIGCDYGQGYLFSKALPIEEFEAMYAINSGYLAISE